MRTLDHDRLIVFCLSDVLRQKISSDYNSERLIVENDNIEKDKDVDQDINKINSNDQDSDSASLCQKNNDINESNSSNNDRSQH